MKGAKRRKVAVQCLEIACVAIYVSFSASNKEVDTANFCFDHRVVWNPFGNLVSHGTSMACGTCFELWSGKKDFQG